MRLFLVPNSIAEDRLDVPTWIAPRLQGVRTFFVEEPKSARRLLRQLNGDFPLSECRFLDLNEHTPASRIGEYGSILKEGDCAIISESGCPCVADPGADLVWLAHQSGVEVIPLVGPSSILLALMASGLNGQSFAFNGYLPKDQAARIQRLKALQRRMSEDGQTQIFMETPYRNEHLFQELISTLGPSVRLCVACDLGSTSQFVRTHAVSFWRKANLRLPRKPCLFIMG